MMGDIVQMPWVYLNGRDTYFFRFETVRDTVKCIRHDTHCLVTHFLCNEMIRNIRQWKWIYAHRFVTHFLCLKMVGDLSYPAWKFEIKRPKWLIILPKRLFPLNAPILSLFIPLGPGKCQILWTEPRSLFESILRSINLFDVKNDEKWWFNC